ncbi:4Fe-4S ferredoxin iron-sulfur binding domain-containing protein [uncultured Sporomusa sp.]|uniref:4Fe-4S ferredoxin iron-sulfur binding domain-containing protein n=1 Tax=uncultured Sporomusa sp. TaxID=307249 RepID=A0A212LUT0_9FIRM|nr:ferredoxin family protein [uncultured Sporomusa sp.]SCM81375.1 4Fe-4S ferredoxin iron-sulfur binding domain-containing protein [uncultured Sporomusa sp.]
MSIRIDSHKCSGCGKCREVCPGSLLRTTDSGRTDIREPKDCWGCTSCLKECSCNAITYYLGADMGGRGSLLHTRQEGNLLHWIVTEPNGREKTITVDKKQANAY